MMSPAKPALCIVNPYEHGGGAEYQISLLIDALAASNRYEIHYLTRFVDVRDRSRNYRVQRVGAGGGIPRLGYLMDGPSLYRALRGIDPCVIYQRVGGAYTGLCALYARRRAIPMVWHVAHDTEVTRQVLDPARNFVRVRLEKRALQYGVRHASRIVVQTQRQAQLLRANYSRTADAVIANFHPPATDAIDKSGPPTVVWIANLKPWKRPEAFVALANALRGLEGVRFVMVGAPAAASGNTAWQDALMRSIDATPNLEYVGQKSHEEVNELLARAHIFVNTSTQEGFPNTFIQAWSRDVAVVSLQVDPDRVLERERTGIHAETETGLHDAVRRLIEDGNCRAEYAGRGRRHAAARHSLANAQDLCRLIDSCCVQPQPKPSGH